MQKRDTSPPKGSRKYRLAIKAIKRRMTEALAAGDWVGAQKHWAEFKRFSGETDELLQAWL